MVPNIMLNIPRHTIYKDRTLKTSGRILRVYDAFEPILNVIKAYVVGHGISI